jgi:hypothetical protein
MRGKFFFANTLVIASFVALLYFRNWQAIAVFLAVLIFLATRYWRVKQ